MRLSALSLALLLLLLLLLPPSPAAAGNRANPLPASLTDAERAELAKAYRGYLRSKYETPWMRAARAPENILRCPGEFERVDGLVIAWEGYDEVLVPLAVEASKDAKVYIGCEPGYVESARSTLVKAGAKAENLKFIPARLDSVWMRDYGPYSILKKDGSVEIIDCLYNRPRPNDDKFPKTLGDALSIPVHPCRLIMPGGNFQTDGRGVVLLTDVVFDPAQGGDPNLSVQQLEKYFADYFGMKKTVLLADMNRDGTGHCDMFSKLLDSERILVGEYATPADGAAGNFDILNRNAELLAKTENGDGKPFKVVRIPMPKYTGTSYTFTNSSYLNKKVFVPVYGNAFDEKGLEVYRKALPDYKVVGINCSGIIHANGAIHCITQQLMAPAARVRHDPAESRVRNGERRVRFTVETGSGAGCRATVLWSVEKEGPFEAVEAVREGGAYVATIPAECGGRPVRYAIGVEADGATVRVPEAGTFGE